MVAVSFFLLLLFNLSLGQEDSPTADDTTDPCECETRTFNEDEMSGTMKFIQSANCTNICTYQYYIKSRPGYVVSLEDKDYFGALVSPGKFSSFYYTGNSDEADMISMGYGELLPKGTDSPAGMGIYIKYRRIKEALSSFYDVEFGFERIPVDELRKMCPPPLLNVTSTIHTISTADWPSKGCTLRIQAEHPVTLQGNMMMTGKATFRLKGNALLLAPKFGTAGHALYTVEPGTDILYRPVLAEEEPTDLAFFALDYDPCNCSTTDFSIDVGQTINVKFADEFAMFCPPMPCSYTVNLTKKPDNDHVTTFIIRTLRLRNAYSFHLRIDDEPVSVDNWLDQYRLNNLNILTGETLEILYYGYGNPEDIGFSMNITAASQPHDCRCPSNSPKTFSGQQESFEMSIPPYCTEMKCDFALHVPPTRNYWGPRPDQMLYFEADYDLHYDYLLIHGKEGIQVLTGGKDEREMPGFEGGIYSNDILPNNSMVTVTYLRSEPPEGKKRAANEISHWKMNWHWLTSNECSCGKTSYSASNKWTAIYSPRYPQDYCLNLNCTYIVEAPEGHHIQFWLQPMEIETEPHRDVLSIFEGNKTLLQFSGHEPNISHIIATETEGQNAVVTFHTDDSIVAKGFKLNYLAIPDVDYVPKAVSGGYLQGLAIVGAILLLAVFIAMGIFLVYRRNLNRAIPPVYSFSPKSDEIVVIDIFDKE